jgi:hypothetical protein
MYFVGCPLRHSKLKNDISFYNVSVDGDLRKDILGGTITNHLAEIIGELDLIFYNQSIYLYIGLFDWIR